MIAQIIYVGVSLSQPEPTRTVIPYHELTSEEIDLDHRLHNHFVDSIKGRLRSMAQHVSFSSQSISLYLV